MARDLSADMIAGITASVVRPALLFDAEFVSSTQYLWTGIGPIQWNGHDYVGIGDLISISPVTENDNVEAAGITVQVAGATLAAISDAFSEMRGGKPGIIRLALLTDDRAIVDSPKVLYRGRLDLVEIDSSDPEKPLLNLSYENALLDLGRARELRFTNVEQLRLYPGDTGFRYVPDVQDKTLTFGWLG